MRTHGLLHATQRTHGGAITPARADGVVGLADGRRLACVEYGDADGRPVFLFHGSPGSRLSWGLLPGDPIPPAVRAIAPDRPGYGRSDPGPGRTLLAWADDMAANPGRPWGFLLEAIAADVTFWICELDRSVPPALGRYLAATVPDSRAIVVPDAGHLRVLWHLREVLDTLVGRGRIVPVDDPTGCLGHGDIDAGATRRCPAGAARIHSTDP